MQEPSGSNNETETDTSAAPTPKTKPYWLGLCLGVTVLLIGAGLSSLFRQYDTDAQLARYVAEKAHCVGKVGDSCTELRFRCNLEDVVFRPYEGPSPKPEFVATATYDPAAGGGAFNPNGQALAALGGGTSIWGLTMQAKELLARPELRLSGSGKTKVLTAGAAIGTATVGWYLGRQKPPDCDGKFKETLATTAFWKYVVQDYSYRQSQRRRD